MNYEREIYFGDETLKVLGWYDDVTLVIPGHGAHSFEPEGAREIAQALIEAADAVDAELAEEARVERIMSTPDPEDA